MIGNLHGGELLLLGLLAILLLGPDRLPEYAAKLAQLVRSLRDMAEGAKGQLRREMGPAFDEIDWQQLDPRQYDPRRIVREALTTPGAGQRGDSAPAVPTPPSAESGGTAPRRARRGSTVPPRPDQPRRRAGMHDPDRPTPFDTDAT